MPLKLTEEEKFFQQEIRRFSREKILPKVQDMDEKEYLCPELIKSFFEMGLMGLEIEEKWGGAGSNFFSACLAIEEISKIDPGVAVFMDVQNTLVNNTFIRWAKEEQKNYFFPKLCKDNVGCFCLTETESGSDAFALKTHGKKVDNGWELSGKKIFITNAKEAHLFIVFANIRPEDGYKGITAFILEKGQQGLRLGKKENKLGIRASSTCEVIMDQVFVPQNRILGEEGKGYKIAIETLNEGRIAVAAQMLGLAQGAFDGAWKYAKERQQFQKTLDQFQAIQFQFSRWATAIHAARLMVYQAARLRDAALPFQKEAAMAKYYVSQVAEKVASEALEIYGGYGFIKEFPAEKFYRDAKIGKLYEGTSNLQLQTIFKMMENDHS